MAFSPQMGTVLSGREIERRNGTPVESTGRAASFRRTFLALFLLALSEVATIAAAAALQEMVLLGAAIALLVLTILFAAILWAKRNAGRVAP